MLAHTTTPPYSGGGGLPATGFSGALIFAALAFLGAGKLALLSRKVGKAWRS